MIKITIFQTIVRIRQIIAGLCFCLYFIALPSGAQEEPPVQDNASVNQFEQWLKKNGYGETKPSESHSAEKPGVMPPSHAVAVSAPASGILILPDPQPPTLEESRQTMMNSIPASVNPEEVDSQKAFDLLMKQNMPLNTNQVVQLHQQIDLAQRAAAVPAIVPPKPVSTTLMINLAPGGTPPAIRLAQGYVTSLVFVDSTGAPWPIVGYEIGNPKATNLQWDGKSNILLLQAVSPYSNGNIVIRLSDLPTPITLELISGQRVVDFRVDIHVSGMGPNAKEISSNITLPGSANQLLLHVLDGVAPPGSKALEVKGGDCQAWLLGDKMYLRMRFIVLSPGWVGKMTSSDGMQAYEMQKSASVLISRYGEPVELKMEGF